MALLRLVSGASFATVNGRTVLQLQNPLQYDYLGLADRGYPKNTMLKDQDNHDHPGLVNISVNPNGDVGCRPTDWTGSWEVCKKQGGLATFSPSGNLDAFVIPYADPA